MRCIIILFVVATFYNVAAEFDNKLLQIFENAIDDAAVSGRCQQALQLYQEDLQASLGGWAFRMFDATSKIPVGLLSLNMGELGQFTQCLATESEDGLIQPRYCLGSIPLVTTTNIAVENKTVALLQKFQRMSHTARGMANLQGARDDDTTDAQSGIYWAICLPTDCSNEDVGKLFDSVLGSTSVTCQTKEDLNPPLTGGAIATIVVLALFAFLLVFTTAADLYYRHIHQESPHVILIAFSAYSNGQKLFRISHNSNELTCLNGIRFLSMLWVLIGHMYTSYSTMPLTNYLDVMNWADGLRSMTILNGTLSVDSFFLLSGLLVVYSYMKAKHHGIKFNIFQFYIHRYLRLTPALVAVILVSAHLLKYMGSGPLWPTIPLLERSCQKYWWSALLYVQNYVNVNDNCVPQTWYLSVDMQLYIIAPLVLYPLWKYPKIGMGIVVLCIGAFIAVPFTIAYVNELPAILTNFNAQEAVADYTSMYYLRTHARAAPWFIGVFIGYILAKIKFQGEHRYLKFNKSGCYVVNFRLLTFRETCRFLTPEIDDVATSPEFIQPCKINVPVIDTIIVMFLMWILSLAVGVSCIYAGHSTLRDAPVEFDKWGNSLYIAFVRPSWSVFLAWVIFACVSGYGGPINWFLSFPIFQVLNRFTYSVYLIHVPLVNIYAYMTKTGVYFDEFAIVWAFWGLTMFSFGLSIFWVLAFESPVVILEKLIFGGATKKKPMEETDRQNKRELPA